MRVKYAMALCGVTDGESKQQTELSERREEDMPVLQTPVPCHDAGTAAMPCPSSLSYSHQEKCRALHLLLKLLHRTHHLAICISEGNQNKMDLKQNMHT